MSVRLAHAKGVYFQEEIDALAPRISTCSIYRATANVIKVSATVLALPIPAALISFLALHARIDAPLFEIEYLRKLGLMPPT